MGRPKQKRARELAFLICRKGTKAIRSYVRLSEYLFAGDQKCRQPTSSAPKLMPRKTLPPVSMPAIGSTAALTRTPSATRLPMRPCWRRNMPIEGRISVASVAVFGRGRPRSSERNLGTKLSSRRGVGRVRSGRARMGIVNCWSGGGRGTISQHSLAGFRSNCHGLAAAWPTA